MTVRATRSAEGGTCLSVEDQGPGVSEAELQRLGQPYQRGDSGAGLQGTGLGYYFCRQIVEAHGGQLSAHNRSSRGLTVTMQLPPLESVLRTDLHRIAQN